MPKIFWKQGNSILYKIIKQNCIDLIREKGYRQLNIRELAKRRVYQQVHFAIL